MINCAALIYSKTRAGKYPIQEQEQETVRYFHSNMHKVSV